MKPERKHAEAAGRGRHHAVKILEHAIQRIELKFLMRPVSEQFHLIRLPGRLKMRNGLFTADDALLKRQVGGDNFAHPFLNPMNHLRSQRGVSVDHGINSAAQRMLNADPPVRVQLRGSQKKYKPQRPFINQAAFCAFIGNEGGLYPLLRRFGQWQRFTAHPDAQRMHIAKLPARSGKIGFALPCADQLSVHIILHL